MNHIWIHQELSISKNFNLLLTIRKWVLSHRSHYMTSEDNYLKLKFWEIRIWFLILPIVLAENRSSKHNKFKKFLCWRFDDETKIFLNNQHPDIPFQYKIELKIIFICNSIPEIPRYYPWTNEIRSIQSTNLSHRIYPEVHSVLRYWRYWISEFAFRKKMHIIRRFQCIVLQIETI